MVDENQVIEPIDPALVEKKFRAGLIIDRDEGLVLKEERRLIKQERQFFKQTTREPLTLRRQMSLAGTFGSGGVQFGAKGISESKRRARRIVTPRFSKAKKEIFKSKKRIIERREGIDLITLATPTNDFGIDLSKFRVDTGFSL